MEQLARSKIKDFVEVAGHSALLEMLRDKTFYEGNGSSPYQNKV